jgi:hypothetical protein
VGERRRSSEALASEQAIRSSAVVEIVRVDAGHLSLRNIGRSRTLSREKRAIRAASDEQFSSPRIENSLSILGDGTRRTKTISARSDDHCLFVDGVWKCVGERCRNPNHRPAS